MQKVQYNKNGEVKIAELLLKSFMEKMVKIVRDKLAMEYDVVHDEVNKNYTGLCDIACDMLNHEIENESAGEGFYGIRLSIMHGEMRHNPGCPSQYWCLQHTWAKVTWERVTLYVDPTSSQFGYIFKDIPDYYIETEPPKWYYDDRKNPVFNGITRTINERVVISHKVDNPPFGKRQVKDGIIEYFQYEVWGKISDTIHKHRHFRREIKK